MWIQVKLDEKTVSNISLIHVNSLHGNLADINARGALTDDNTAASSKYTHWINIATDSDSLEDLG